MMNNQVKEQRFDIQGMITGGMAMKNWMDLNGDGKIDGAEMMFAGEMLCTSREEHEALFGDAGDFKDDTKEDFEIDAM